MFNTTLRTRLPKHNTTLMLRVGQKVPKGGTKGHKGDSVGAKVCTCNSNTKGSVKYVSTTQLG